MIFSVVIPIYNAEKHIRHSLDSILRQDERNFEVVIVNDGSTDQSGPIADEYAGRDARIRVIHQENKGSFHARCVALGEARGEFVVFVDADDSLRPDALSTLKSELSGSDMDIIIYRAETVSASGQRALLRKIFEDGQVFEGESKETIYRELLLGSSLNPMWIKAVRRECFDMFPLESYPRIKMGDDLLQSLGAFTNARRIKYIDRPLYNYRINASGITGTFDPMVYDAYRVIYRDFLRYLEKWEIENFDKYELYYSRYLASISSILFFSPYDIRGKEDVYLSLLKEVRSDPGFLEAYDKGMNGLSLPRKIAMYLLKNGQYGLLSRLKPLVTKMRRWH